MLIFALKPTYVRTTVRLAVEGTLLDPSSDAHGRIWHSSNIRRRVGDNPCLLETSSGNRYMLKGPMHIPSHIDLCALSFRAFYLANYAHFNSCVVR